MKIIPFLDAYPKWARVVVVSSVVVALLLLVFTCLVLIFTPRHTTGEASQADKPLTGLNQAPIIQVVGNNNPITVSQTVHNETLAQDSLGRLATKEEIEAVLESVAALGEKINRNTVQDPTLDYVKLDGFSFVIVASFSRINRAERKYIFDTGSYSLFFDAENSLRFSAKDSAGELHSTKIDLGKDTFDFNKFVVLTGEAGSSPKHSFIRFSANGKKVSEVQVDQDLKFPSIEQKTMVLGADLQGARPGKFFMMDFVHYRETLRQKDVQNMVKHLVFEGKKEWVEFAGKQWLTTGKDNNLVQPVAELQPRIWINGKPSDGYISIVYNQARK